MYGVFCVPIRANLLDLVSQFHFWFFLSPPLVLVVSACGHELDWAVHVRLASLGFSSWLVRSISILLRVAN